MIKLTFMLFTAAFMCGCASSKSGLSVSGPSGEVAIIHGAWNDMCQELQHDPKQAAGGLKITMRYSEESGRNNYGPYTCRGGEGCWHGINRQGGRSHVIEWPKGVKHETKRHEVLHSIHKRLGNMVGPNLSPGHGKYTRRKDGTLIESGHLAVARWPQKTLPFIQSLLPGGPRPQDYWGYSPGGILCGTKD